MSCFSGTDDTKATDKLPLNTRQPPNPNTWNGFAEAALLSTQPSESRAPRFDPANFLYHIIWSNTVSIQQTSCIVLYDPAGPAP
jgi:hypothetical protein